MEHQRTEMNLLEGGGVGEITVKHLLEDEGVGGIPEMHFWRVEV